MNHNSSVTVFAVFGLAFSALAIRWSYSSIRKREMVSRFGFVSGKLAVILGIYGLVTGIAVGIFSLAVLMGLFG